MYGFSISTPRETLTTEDTEEKKNEESKLELEAG
jgi:hypothetical protein